MNQTHAKPENCFEFPSTRMPKSHPSYYFSQRELAACGIHVSWVCRLPAPLKLHLFSSQFLLGFFVQLLNLLLLFVSSSSFSLYPCYHLPSLFWLLFFDIRDSLGLEAKQSRGTKHLNKSLIFPRTANLWNENSNSNNSRGVEAVIVTTHHNSFR